MWYLPLKNDFMETSFHIIWLIAKCVHNLKVYRLYGLTYCMLGEPATTCN